MPAMTCLGVQSGRAMADWMRRGVGWGGVGVITATERRSHTLAASLICLVDPSAFLTPVT